MFAQLLGPDCVAQSVLVTRPEFDPQVHLLPSGAAQVIAQLGQGKTLGTALEAAHDAQAEFDFGTTLGLLLENRALGALHRPQTT